MKYRKRASHSEGAEWWEPVKVEGGKWHIHVCGGESGCGEIWRQEEGLEERRWRSRGPGDGWGVENPGAELRC